MLCEMLSEKLTGGGKVDSSNIHSTMLTLFGDAASGKSKLSQVRQKHKEHRASQFSEQSPRS